MVWTLGANKWSEPSTCEGSIKASLREWMSHMGDYLESLSFYYGENVRAAEKLPPKGSKWLLLRGSRRGL